MKFKKYCEFLEKIEKESSRNTITIYLAEMFKNLKDKEMRQAIYLMKGRVVPEYMPLEMNFSNKSFVNALQELVFKMNLKYDVKKKFQKFGDSGLLAEDFIKLISNKSKGFDIIDIFDEIYHLASIEGEGAVKAKSDIVINLIQRLTSIEAKYFARIITGKLRLGMSDKTILDGISWAQKNDKSLREDLDRAYGLKADIGRLAEKVLISFSDFDLTDIEITLGIPLKAQLVEREKNAEKIMQRMTKAFVQPKYDGLRAQLHYSKKGFEEKLEKRKKEKTLFQNQNFDESHEKVRIFSRNLESMTDMFPDLIKVFDHQDFDSVIIDGEIIGFDENTSTFLPFQETIQRKRKYGVKKAAQDIPIKFFMFDCLEYNGKDLTQFELQKRLDQLNKIPFKDLKNILEITHTPIVKNADELNKNFLKLLDENLEGVVVKDPKSIYQPGKRGYDWIKLKPNTHSELQDSVDGVIMGYYFGKGQRAKFGIGGFLIGVYDQKNDLFLSIAKVGSGVKEDEWQKIKASLDKIKVKTLPQRYKIEKTLMPDIIVAPEIVIEVDADEITKSNKHTSKFSLRFPRLKIFDRDKDPEQSTSIEEIQKMYKISDKS